MTLTETPLYCGAYGFHQMDEGEYAGISAADVIKRMKHATRCTNLYELAIHLKTSHADIRDEKRRNIIPVVWVRELISTHGETSPIWLLTGKIDEAWNKGLRLCGGFSEDYNTPLQ
jgi:hypothetical protein